MMRLRVRAIASLGFVTAFAGLLAMKSQAETLAPLGFGGISIVEGTLFVALAATLAHGSRLARFVVAGLLLLDTVLLIAQAGEHFGAPDIVLSALRLGLIVLLLWRTGEPEILQPVPMPVMQPVATTSSTLTDATGTIESGHADAAPVTESSREDEAPSSSQSEEPSQANHPPSAPVLANIPDEHGMVRCPRCSVRQLDGGTCFSCGIDFARYWNARRRVVELEAKLGRPRTPRAD